MSVRRRRVTRTAGVSLEVVVLDYLRDIAERDERDRSYCINQIVREHAARQGQPLPPPALPSGPKRNQNTQEQSS